MFMQFACQLCVPSSCRLLYVPTIKINIKSSSSNNNKSYRVAVAATGDDAANVRARDFGTLHH